jgi:hypothetical protein
MLDDRWLAPGKRCHKVDGSVEEEVVVLALKSWVRLLLDFKNDVPGLDSRSLIALTPEVDLVTCANTPIHVNVQHLSLHDRLLCHCSPCTRSFSRMISPSPLQSGQTVWNRWIIGSHLAHHSLHAMPVASRALLDRTLFSHRVHHTFGQMTDF